MVANTDKTNKLLHQHLGHINFGTLCYMNCLRMADGLSLIQPPNGVCEECMLGEHHHDSFPKSIVGQVARPLAFVHGDICGPMATHLGGAQYLLTFIYDLCCFLWILFNTRMELVGDSRNLTLWWKITTITGSNLSGLIVEIDTLVMAFIHLSHLMALFGKNMSLRKMKWCIEEVEPM
jgi:hypothetical protein